MKRTVRLQLLKRTLICTLLLFSFLYIQEGLAQSSKTPAAAQGAKNNQNQAAAAMEGKSPRKVTREADELYIDQMFKAALPFYLQLDALKPQNSEINYKIGICYLHTETKGKSIPYFLKAQQYDKKHEFEDINYYIGTAYHYALEFDKAIESYEKYKLLLKPNQQFSKDMTHLVNKFVANCYSGKSLIKKPLQVNIQNLGIKINSASHEAYPVISPDDRNLYFSSKRIDLRGLKADEEPEELFEDIYVSTKSGTDWAPARKIGKGINTFKHDAPLSISPDGKKLFFYKTDKNNSTDIYYIEYKDTSWSSPKPMGGRINSPSWETGASISSDGKTFYFSSDRAGGFGGMDIYVCRWMESKATWGTPINIGPEINTEWDEEAPYVLPDGRTLYFGNNGPKSIGGLDIFKSVFNLTDSLWSVPENVGYPINSPEHEVHISWTAKGNKGYYASNRTDSYGEEDVYSVEFQQGDAPEPTFVASKDSIVTKKFAAPRPGETLPQKVYFDFNIAASYAEFSQPKLLEVVELLQKFPEVKLEMGGHADNQGDPDVNHLISNKRAETIYNYLVSKGIDASRLSTKAYSNTQIIVNGQSTIENAINRRVEFKVLPSTASIK